MACFPVPYMTCLRLEQWTKGQPGVLYGESTKLLLGAPLNATLIRCFLGPTKVCKS